MCSLKLNKADLISNDEMLDDYFFLVIMQSQNKNALL